MYYNATQQQTNRERAKESNLRTSSLVTAHRTVPVCNFLNLRASLYLSLSVTLVYIVFHLPSSICWILPFYATRALFVVGPSAAAAAVGTLLDDGVGWKMQKYLEIASRHTQNYECGGESAVN